MDATPEVVLWSGAFLCVLGALMVAWGVRDLRRQRRKERAGGHTTGTVVENRVSVDIENSTLIHPIIEFTTSAEQTLRVELPWSTQVQYEVGTAVPVYYDPAHPEAAGAMGQGRLVLILLMAFGACVIAFGLSFVAIGIAGRLFGFPRSN